MRHHNFRSVADASRVAAVAGLVALAGALPAFAASDGGGTSGSDSAPPKCRQGLVWDKKLQRCVRAQSSNLPDKELLDQGRALALAGFYDDALIVLDAVRNKQDAVVLTYTGYSHRKKGDTDIGIGFYKQALGIDPNNINTREYLGEGYASAGRMELAKAEVGIIQRLCGSKQCEQYSDLAAAISGEPVD
jgi:tetratricopeptide (TPR) repeat protein